MNTEQGSRSLVRGSSDPVVEEWRCVGEMRDLGHCDKLLMKMQVFAEFSVELKKLVEEKGIPISKIFEGVELKFGIESKCNRCKTMNYKLLVI